MQITIREPVSSLTHLAAMFLTAGASIPEDNSLRNIQSFSRYYMYVVSVIRSNNYNFESYIFILSFNSINSNFFTQIDILDFCDGIGAFFVIITIAFIFV